LNQARWAQIPAQMPVPLIEPCLVIGNSMNAYLIGDFDQPLPGMPPDGTHIRFLKISGFSQLNPPSYNQALNAPTTYPTGNNPYPSGNNPMYPTANNPYPSSTPPYPAQNPPYPQQSQFNEPYPPGRDQGPQRGYAGGEPSTYNMGPGSNYGNQPGQPGNEPPSYGGGGGPSDYSKPQEQYPVYPPQKKDKDCCVM